MKLPCEDCAKSGKCNLTLSCKQKVSLNPLSTLSIHIGEKEHVFTLGSKKIEGNTLKGCTLAMGRVMGWGIDTESVLEALKGMPDSDNRKLLIGILEGR